MLAFGLAACTNENENLIPEDPVAAQVSASIQGALTKAQDQTWGQGDQIGISTTSTSTETRYTNMCYTTTGNGNFTHEGGDATGIFFQGTEEVTFSAYYPFTGNEGEQPTITADTQEQSKQTTFDFLFADGVQASKASPTLAFTFAHKMTRLVLNIKPGTDAGLTQDEVQKGTYTLSGIAHTGSFDVTNGTAQATGTPTSDWTIAPLSTTSDGLTCNLILFPQTLASDLTFQATIQGKTYSCTFKPELKASTSYTYDISVMKEKLAVGTCQINEWTPGTGDSLNAEM